MYRSISRPVVRSAVYPSMRDMIRFIWINLVEVLYLSPSQSPIKYRGADHTLGDGRGWITRYAWFWDDKV